MTEELQHKLTGLHFTTFQETVQNVLEACDIGKTTVAKITERIGTSKSLTPLFVYKCAVLFCCNTFEEESFQTFLRSTPLVMVFTPDSLHINAGNEWRTVGYEELADNTDLLSAFFDYGFSQRDPYASLALEELVESLFRELMTNDSDPDASRQAIFNVLYISFCNHLLKLSEVEFILKHDGMTGVQKLKSLYKYYEDNGCGFVKTNTRRINLSKEAEDYISAITKFDFSQVDMEVLSSLVYKMVRSNEVGVYGYKASFVNILKTLRPLLLDVVQAEIDEASYLTEKAAVKKKIQEIKVFDPTDGPGCYLSAAYFGLLEKLRYIDAVCNTGERTQLNISNFIALTSNALAAELTKMSLLLNHVRELYLERPITLKEIGDIYDNLNVTVVDSILHKDWHELVTPTKDLFIVGSPKFLGSHRISPQQKGEMQTLFESEKLFYADYSSSWLVKTAKFIRGTKAHATFVLTNSVAQGEQASFIGETVAKNGCEYYFCYRSFKWPLSEASVTVVIIGICDRGANEGKRKRIYSEDNPPIECNYITPLLWPEGMSVNIKNHRKPLVSYMPPMRKGNMTYCADPLIFASEMELHEFIGKCPEAKPYVRPLMGSEEMIDGKLRWCLWIRDREAKSAMTLPAVAERVEKVRELRKDSAATQKLKESPYRFREQYETAKGKITLVVPALSSENREYIPIIFVDENVIINNLAFAIYNCELYMLPLLESKMHMLWAKQYSGGRETRPRYLGEKCYNAFPAPEVTPKDKKMLTDLARTLIEIREKYCDRSIGSLYSKMPPELRQIHQLIDRKVESLYRSRPFETDSERLIFLNTLYNKLTKDG